MAFGSEIAAAYVRIRPALGEFKTELLTEVKGTLRQIQTEVSASSKANIASTRAEIASNDELAASYRTIQAQSQAAAAASGEVAALNQKLSVTYAELAGAAKAGSVERVEYEKMARESAAASAVALKEAAAQNIAATKAEISANDALAASARAAAAAEISSAGSAAAANEALASSYKIVIAGSQAAITSAVEGAALNRRLAVGYGELAAAAREGSVERQAYEKLAREAVLNSSVTIEETARANIAITAAEIRANEELAASYALIGRSARRGSAEAAAAARLGGAAAAAGGVARGAGAAEAGAVGGIVGKGVGLGAALGVTIGTVELIKFAREVSKDAGEVQKFREVVDSEFGSSSKAVEGFAEHGAQKLLITQHAALDTASRFGILFKNLGIGQGQSAKMTIGFEQLAGALSEIRGQDPNVVLAKLPLVAAGNTRALKQLGLSIDQTEIKYEALKLGLISSVNDAVTPAIKAQAVYALATANLGSYIAQAKAHQDDFANSSRRLHNEFIGIKESIGEAVLPVLARITAYLANELPKAVDYVRAEFHKIAPELRADVATLEAIWARWGATIKRVVDVDLKGTIAIIKNQLSFLQGIFDVVTGILTGDWSKFWKGLKEIPRAALGEVRAVISAWGNVVVAVFDGIWNNVKASVLELELWIVKQFARIPTQIKTPFGSVGFTNPFQGLKEGLQSELDGLRADKAAAKALANVGKDQAALSAAKASGNDLGTAINQGIDDALLHPSDKEQEALAALRLRLKQSIAKEAADVKASVIDAKQNLTTLGSSLATSLGTIIDQPFVIAGQKIQEAQDKLNLMFDRKEAGLNRQAASITRQQQQIAAAGNKLTLDNLRDSVYLPGAAQLSSDPKKALAQLHGLEEGAGKKNASALREFIQQYQSAVLQVQSDKVSAKTAAIEARKTVMENTLKLKSEVLQVEQDTATQLKTQITTQIADLTDEFNRNVITYAQFKAGIEDIAAKGGPAMKAAGKTLGTAFGNEFNQEVADILQQAGYLAAGPQVKGTTGKESKVVNPAVVAAKDAAATERIRTQIANKQTSIQERIAKEQKKQTTYLQQIAGARAPKAPTSQQKNPGTQSGTSRVYNKPGGG